MKNERIPHHVIKILAISKAHGLLVTSAYARRARCYVSAEPTKWCSFSDVKGLCQFFEEVVSKPVPEVDLNFEEAKNSSVPSSILGGAKTVLISISVLPDSYHLRILRTNSKGEWLNSPYALEENYSPSGGLEPVALAISRHMKTCKDLPEEANMPSRSIA